MKIKGRDKEALIIRKANLACAAGRLLLGEIRTWQEFLEPETVDYCSLPRKQLKNGKFDVQKSVKGRIDNFCKSNFSNMTQSKLELLYEELKKYQHLEIPYTEFKDKYSPVKGFYEKGYPEYSTVCISLWGLQYRFPEHDFSNDMVISIEQLLMTDEKLDEYRGKQHTQLVKAKDNISELIRKNESAKRQILQTAFSLLECYLNGLAWSYFQENNEALSNNKSNTLQGKSVTLRDKIQKYPSIIFNKKLDENAYQFLMDEAKQFRDSLMHPSPFSAPENFGGYDKLEKVYNLDLRTISKLVQGVIDVIEKIESMKEKTAPVPIWLPRIKKAANNLLHWSTKSQA